MESAEPASEIQEAEREWTELVRRIARGDAAALTGLYEATSRYVYGLIFRIVQDPGEADELTLDVYTQVWRQAADYDEVCGTPSAWLLSIARTRAIDRLRSFSPRDISLFEPFGPADQAPDSSSSPEKGSLMQPRRMMVLSALTDLTPEQRETLDLAYFCGLSRSEIAARTGQSQVTVGAQLRKSMTRLRENLLAS
jgi:RNA polymerase sigma-70 factor (ECF subfamily)